MYVQANRLYKCLCRQTNKITIRLCVYTLTPVEINVRSHVPVYLQLATGLRKMITAGELSAGHVFPGEHAMAQEYGVGREAVRKALSVLRQEGLVATRRGEASYVRAQPERRRIELEPGTNAWFRQTTPEERIDLGLDEGVGLLVVERPGEPAQLLPADEVVLTAKGKARQS